MVRYLFILSFFLYSCSKGQSPVFAAYVQPSALPAETGQDFIIYFWGESNSGGAAPNDSASAPELAQREKTFILNNNLGGVPLAFIPLDIGTNNLVGHHGFSNQGENNNTLHGWENHIANLVETDPYFDTVWIVKTGQGGSTLTMWTYDTAGQTFYIRMTTRMDSSLLLLGNRPDVKRVVFASIGINDHFLATSQANFKSRYATAVQYIRLHLGASTPVITTKFSTVTTYNTAMDEMENEVDDFYAVDATGAGTIVGDGLHWGYQGNKVMAQRMVDVIKSIYP